MSNKKGPLEIFAEKTTRWAGSSWALVMAFAVIVLWLASGPFFDFSDTWQLVINTATTIVTFLMVFLIQRAQNKESLAVQLKLDELIIALQGARNALVNLEDLSEADAVKLREEFREVACSRQSGTK
jgi:low affinity Fe/Cu permease